MAFRLSTVLLSRNLLPTRTYGILCPRLPMLASASRNLKTYAGSKTGTLSPSASWWSPGNLWIRFKQHLGFPINLRYKRRELIMAGENMYAFCAEYPQYDEFVNHLRLPDTFQTWFALTSLHIWLCSVRLRAEGEDGKLAREAMFQTLFKDIRSRSRHFHPAQRQKQLKIVQKQLYGALFAYDEGILSRDDRVLAGALWRVLFFLDEVVEPWELELMVQYIHKQLRHIDGQTSHQILCAGMLTFLPLVGDELDEDYANKRIKHTLSRPEKKKSSV